MDGRGEEEAVRRVGRQVECANLEFCTVQVGELRRRVVDSKPTTGRHILVVNSAPFPRLSHALRANRGPHTAISHCCETRLAWEIVMLPISCLFACRCHYVTRSAQSLSRVGGLLIGKWEGGWKIARAVVSGGWRSRVIEYN